ncbi:hypothetical protein SELMODRAFT_25328, partial [Selaginella moellendorffii]
FSGNYDITWAPDHVDVIGHGQEVDLRLDRSSGAGFGSKNRFLFGQLGLQIKLVPYDSSGTIVAYMLSSLTDDRDELDFEFLGNSTGQSYTLQTNLFVSGKGKREQRFKLWFDPTADFHFYSFVWNPFQVIFMVDDIPVRVFKNTTDPYPSTKPMGIYTNIWGSSSVDWDHAPFVASYRGFTIDACQYSETSPDDCHDTNSQRWWSSLEWNDQLQGNLSFVRRNYMIDDYCSAYESPPLECT